MHQAVIAAWCVLTRPLRWLVAQGYRVHGKDDSGGAKDWPPVSKGGSPSPRTDTAKSAG